jgi:hypothetical protein
MLVLDKEKETFEESTVLPWGNSCSDKRDRCFMAKVVDNYRHTNTCIAVYTFR